MKQKIEDLEHAKVKVGDKNIHGDVCIGFGFKGTPIYYHNDPDCGPDPRGNVELVAGGLEAAKATDSDILFHDHGELVGRLSLNTKPIKFIGDADKSAKIFFDIVIKKIIEAQG